MVKFGDMLVSRPAGKEAYLAAKAYVLPSDSSEELVLDFSGINVLTPSWADEFVTPLEKEHGDKVKYLHTDNLSVRDTLELLKSITISH